MCPAIAARDRPCAVAPFGHGLRVPVVEFARESDALRVPTIEMKLPVLRESKRRERAEDEAKQEP